jgi:hypothetical protein
MSDRSSRLRILSDMPHPDSPAGRAFHWSSLGVPHPYSPAGRHFDYLSTLGMPPPKSPIRRQANHEWQEAARSRHSSLLARQRKIQMLYQKLVQKSQTEEARVQSMQAAFGQSSIGVLREVIENLVGLIKKTPPSEDPGESPMHYVEFLLKCKELLGTTVKTLDGIIDSRTSLAEVDLQLQKLNQSSAETNAAIRALSDISKRVRNPDIRLREIPEPERDWGTLDQAIEQMRKEDLPGR